MSDNLLSPGFMFPTKFTITELKYCAFYQGTYGWPVFISMIIFNLFLLIDFYSTDRRKPDVKIEVSVEDSNAPCFPGEHTRNHIINESEYNNDKN